MLVEVDVEVDVVVEVVGIGAKFAVSVNESPPVNAAPTVGDGFVPVYPSALHVTPDVKSVQIHPLNWYPAPGDSDSWTDAVS